MMNNFETPDTGNENVDQEKNNIDAPSLEEVEKKFGEQAEKMGDMRKVEEQDRINDEAAAEDILKDLNGEEVEPAEEVPSFEEWKELVLDDEQVHSLMESPHLIIEGMGDELAPLLESESLEEGVEQNYKQMYRDIAMRQARWIIVKTESARYMTQETIDAGNRVNDQLSGSNDYEVDEKVDHWTEKQDEIDQKRSDALKKVYDYGSAMEKGELTAEQNQEAKDFVWDFLKNQGVERGDPNWKENLKSAMSNFHKQAEQTKEEWNNSLYNTGYNPEQENG